MDNTGPCKKKSRKRAYFIVVTGAANQIRKKEYDTPCQRMDYDIKIPVFNYAHHLKPHAVVHAIKRNRLNQGKIIDHPDNADYEKDVSIDIIPIAINFHMVAAFTSLVYLPGKLRLP